MRRQVRDSIKRSRISDQPNRLLLTGGEKLLNLKVQRQIGLSGGNLGGLFSFWSSPFSSARVFGYDRGSAPRASLILPLFKKLSQRGFRALFEPLAEFRVVLAGDLDSDRLAID